MFQRYIRFAIIFITGEDAKVQSYHARNVEPTWKVSLFETLRGFSRIGIIVGYAFLCDRCVLATVVSHLCLLIRVMALLYLANQTVLKRFSKEVFSF